ncbi:MAG: SH3 domain-containing protein [Ruminococcus sp.]|nr:SH3 domain-containing protein [Ruminococcus sp.]
MKNLKKITAMLLIIVLVASLQLLPVQAANKYPTGYIKSDGVNLRSGADTSYSVITTMAKKTTAKLLSCKLYNKEWYKIKISSGQKGYVNKSYFKIDSNQIYIPASMTGYKGYTAVFTNVLNTTGKTASWSSSNTSVATVNSSGRVSCKKTGSTTITLKAGSLSMTSKFTVKNAEVKLDKTELTMFSDDSPVTLTATCVRPVTWTSSNTAVATVEHGVVTPKGTGTAKIKATCKSGEAACTVTVKKRVITLSVTKTTMYTGNYALITPSGGKSSYTYSSNNTSVATVTDKGIVNAAGTGTATITVKSGTLKATKKFTVQSGSSINLSNTASTLFATKTLYLKSRTGGVKWKTSSKDIATVSNGYVYGVKKGYAVISAYTASGCKDCLVTVRSAEAVRFVYTSENSVLLNNTVKLCAITDVKRANVKFKLTDSSGNSRWVKKPSKSETSKRITWTASTKMTEAGVYTISAYAQSKASKSWSTSEGGKSTFFVSSETSRATTAAGERRATTSLLKNIASFEGYLSKVTPDALVADSPTLGYGKVVFAGETFYNGMTKTEAFAYLTKTVNESGFTSRVNKLLTDNKIRFNQAHFDAMVDFSYNLGAYAIEYDSDFMDMLKNTYGKEANKLKGYVRVTSTDLKKTADSSSATLKTIVGGTSVTLKDATVYNKSWYKVTYSGKTGYVKTSHIKRRTTSTTKRDLSNVDFAKLKSNILPYHHASGTCYWGLLYRRIDEVEMFFFRDYSVDGSSNDYKIKYHCPRNSGFGVG